MANRIFFSWQVDTPTRTGRNLVERALERAIGRVAADFELDEAVRDIGLDKDTMGVPGSPPIVDTILKKIESAAIFVPDLTFVASRLNGRPSPNPNVLIEYGWALKSLGHSRILPVMNSAFGAPTRDSMPFDLSHLRHPAIYNCPDDADDSQRSSARDDLARQLEARIRDVLQSDGFTLSQAPQPSAFIGREPLDGPARFRPPGIAIGQSYERWLTAPAPTAVKLADGPCIWLRVLPSIDPARRWSFNELREASEEAGILHPINLGGSGDLGYIHAVDGFAVRLMENTRDTTHLVVAAFETGEIWSVDSFHLSVTRNQPQVGIPLDEKSLGRSLDEYASFLARLGVSPPYHWIAGMEDLQGRGMWVPDRPGFRSLGGPQGHCIEATVSTQGLHRSDQSGHRSLRPFFELLYDRCGIRRPDWLDQGADDTQAG